MDAKRYKPPGLKGHAARFWEDVTESYTLRLDELIVLGNACKEINLIEQISAEQMTRSMVAEGSMGQEVADPMITELRQHRATLATLLRQLKLPEDPASGRGETRQDASEKARMAANARWAKVRETG